MALKIHALGARGETFCLHLLVDVALLNNDHVESKLAGTKVLGPRVCVALFCWSLRFSTLQGILAVMLPWILL